ncbi:oligoendopeptidase F [Leadbettera azotonutricia]|uniref:Oligopeptidase F n=1 Tax=Leadbettera azotonutricia (strain ATCC BAA-888 / DSM 13862 / ZAS-9) TaxID=545695 RepID=F5YFK9_LEAAZ|nr:oligoendopeptidase F [Leadbettera azotonutricia]AEF83440.1 oligoendopeptidase F [Leadbettera azotonutricia ZAS-9]
MSQETIPSRKEAKKEDTWDLSRLYPNDEAWSAALSDFEILAEKIPSFRGTLAKSAEDLAAWLDFQKEFGLLEERLNYYADLRQTEDEGDSAARTMTGRLMMAASKAQASSSWAAPEIMAIPDQDIVTYIVHPKLSEYRVYLQKLLRYKPHILSDKEEKILALHAEGELVSEDAFSVLTNVDMDFGAIDTPQGKRPLSQSTWSVFMENPDRELRKKVYGTFYGHFEAHKNTLASLYSGQVKLDVIRARVRGFPSARAAALFSDDVDESVYDNLIDTISRNLAPLHHYYSLRKKTLKVPELRHYDVYVPMVPVANTKRTTWNEAVDLVSKALAPLGGEYVDTLRGGLLGRWADRYENKGKRSGAFSAGSYVGDPYILMNYKEDAIRDVFTMAHEGGHSMHSWYSAKSNPFMHYGYTIFEAEVASTFNEELLFRYLMQNADSKELKLYLVNKRVDETLATLYRQTMFAEFEKLSHQLEEGGTPLTVDVLRGEYRKLLEKYFGPEMVLENESDLEGLRIPHFYRAFYVYKYATGISASLALSERVLSGGSKEREDYFCFLKSGGSRFPIESLKVAGVDMSSPAPVEAACRSFGRLVDQLEGML